MELSVREAGKPPSSEAGPGGPARSAESGDVELVTEATRAMGVDLGSVRIGLALSDPSRVVASPHDVLARAKDHATDHHAIVGAARREGASTIVVGLPLSLSGGKGPAARAALAEVEALRAVAAPAGITVVMHDERLTTVTAERALNEARVKRTDRKQVVDKVAAAVMLQAWLDAGAPA
jgi:putative Holliday junction resolvase